MMVHASNELLNFNGPPRESGAPASDVVLTKLPPTISAAPFSDTSIIGEMERDVRAGTALGQPKSPGAIGAPKQTPVSDTSVDSELRFAESFRVQDDLHRPGSHLIETIFPVLRETPSSEETPSFLESGDIIEATCAESQDDERASARIDKLRTALFGTPLQSQVPPVLRFNQSGPLAG
jgi:hypothetical protein